MEARTMTRIYYSAMKQRPLPIPTIKDLERIAKQITREGECWVWQGTLRTGYARTMIDGQMTQLTRVMRHIIFGDVESGLVVDHLCRNPACINPRHLEPITQRENIMRGEGICSKKVKQVRCIHGHALVAPNLLKGYGHHRKCKECHRIVSKRWRVAQGGAV